MLMRTLQCTHRVQGLELVEVSGEIVLTEGIGAVSKVTGEISQALDQGEISRETILINHQIKGLILAVTGDKSDPGEITTIALDTNPILPGEIATTMEINLIIQGETLQITGV